ncbi:MAG TPA: polysaccharide biosynthesis tyrosine autokinase [Geodermatophilus sp.]|nr:polysaccharide biosynthesis tyrosine autokinase [Geodermatophilus sp.]
MDVRDYLRVVRAHWVLLVAGLLLGAVAAATVSLLLPKQYTAETQLFVSTTGSSDLATAVQGNHYAEQKVASYAELVRSKELATAVIDDLGLDMTALELQERIEAEVVVDTTILDVAVTDPSPQQALAIAESIDAEFAALVRLLETPEGETRSPVRVTVIATPELPESPSSPAVVANTALGAVLGLALAAVTAVVRDRLDTTVKDDTVAAEIAGAPVVGHVPADAELATRHVLESHSTSRTAEAFRHVRTNLAFLDVDDPPRSILVSSALPGEGKTTVAVNLALALARSGKTVTLIEGDLRSPRVIRYLGLVGGVGLTTVLAGQAELEEVVQPLDGGALQVLGAGRTPPNPGELLSSQAMRALVKDLLAERDMVVIDAPPVLPVADAAALAPFVDGVLVCARWGGVTGDQLTRTTAALKRVGADILGVVLTMVPARAEPVAYGYGETEVEPTGRRTWRRPAVAQVSAAQPPA